MKSPLLKVFRIVFCLVGLLFQASAGWTQVTGPFDHSAWQRFLEESVNEKGEVDYQAVAHNPSNLKAYFDKVARVDFLEFREDWPREERIAFLINLYNAGVIQQIARRYPVRQVHEIPNMWEEQRIQVGDKTWSLDEIRQIHLLGTFRDEKLHFALSCGAKSCPRLRREAYTGPRTEGLLFLAVREFVNDPAKNRILPGSRKIEISKMFQWYRKDFQMGFGTFENVRRLPPEEFAVLSFLVYHLEDPEKIAYLEESKYKLKYLPFDWSLNEWVRES